MKQKKPAIFIIISMFCSLVFASFGPEVSKYNGKELKWIDEPVNYAVMFKSNLDKDYSCLNNSKGSIYTLDTSHIPGDAHVERAFLIWTGTVHNDKTALPPDNEVQLNFNSTDDQISLSQTVTGSDYKLTDANRFEFSSVRDSGFNTSYYIYRTDVTDFFQSLHEKGRDPGLEYDGYSIFGDYSVSGLNCFSNKDYPEATLSDWSVVLIYSSTQIAPNNVHIYDNFQHLRNEYLESELTGFDLNRDPKVKMTFINHLGTLGVPSLPDFNTGERVSEGIWVQGDHDSWLSLEDECNIFHGDQNNFETLNYTDIFNSISSVFGWTDRESICIGGKPQTPDNKNIEKNIEADTFFMNASTNGSYATHFDLGTKAIKLKYGANVDDVLTDLVIVSTDQKKPPNLHYYPEREHVACTPCAEKGDYWCESDLEYTFVIRLKNYGERIAEDIAIKTSIPEGMEYVKNSTEYSNSMYPMNEIDGDKYLYSNKWTSIPDGKDGEFPLKDETVVLKELVPDNTNDMVQPHLALFVRYRATLKKGRLKSMVIESGAEIGIKGSSKMHTNSGIPLRLRFNDSSLENQKDIDMSQCGTKRPEESDIANDNDSAQDIELIDDIDKRNDGCSITLI